jgi:hypothetical protein
MPSNPYPFISFMEELRYKNSEKPVPFQWDNSDELF